MVGGRWGFSKKSTLEDNSITNAKMADNAINTAEIVNGAVTPAKLDRAYAQTLYSNGDRAYGQLLKISDVHGTGVLSNYFKLTSGWTPTSYLTSTEHGMQFGSGTGIFGYIPKDQAIAMRGLYRDLEITLTMRFSFDKNGDNNADIYMGLTDDNLSTENGLMGTAFADNSECLLFGMVEGDTTFSTIRNDGGVTPTKSDTKTIDTNPHTVIITLGSSNGTVKFDSDTTSTYTTEIPALGTGLAIVMSCNAPVAWSSKIFRVLGIKLEYNWRGL